MSFWNRIVGDKMKSASEVIQGLDARTLALLGIHHYEPQLMRSHSSLDAGAIALVTAKLSHRANALQANEFKAELIDAFTKAGITNYHVESQRTIYDWNAGPSEIDQVGEVKARFVDETGRMHDLRADMFNAFKDAVYHDVPKGVAAAFIRSGTMTEDSGVYNPEVTEGKFADIPHEGRVSYVLSRVGATFDTFR